MLEDYIDIMNSCSQYVDLKVTKSKFDLEFNKFSQSKEIQRKRGIILLEAEFPNIFIAFSITTLKPAPIAFAVKINFDNYDFEPPSVVFVNPFTLEPIALLKDIGIVFPRKIDNSLLPQALLQQNERKLPFICFPGVREYHNHPAHTGDSWFLHRSIGGEGSLGFIIDKLYEYGISSIVSYQAVINFSGLSLAVDPKKIPL